MAKSFVGVINELADVSTEMRKKALSDQASKLLIPKKDQANLIIIPIIDSLKRSVELKTFKDISESEFYDLEILPYFDGDILRVSIQISFLQEYVDPIDGFSEKIAFFLFNELLKRNLDILVNDICVNDVQCRNGILISS